MYDPAVKERIYYPKAVVGDTPVTTLSSATEITDSLTGTQTGAFQVTVGFSEVQEIAAFTVNRVTHANHKTRDNVPVPGASVSVFVAHDVSDEGVATSQTSVTAALAAAEPP